MAYCFGWAYLQVEYMNNFKQIIRFAKCREENKMKKVMPFAMLALLLVSVLSACGSYALPSNDISSDNNAPYDALLSHEILDYRFSESDELLDCISFQNELLDVQVSPDIFALPNSEASFAHTTFEDAITEFATDVVIAQYVGSRPFGLSLTEFEFIVLDRILGYAEDRIFVYIDNAVSADIFGVEMSVSYISGNLAFSIGTTYLLPLIRISRAHTNVQNEGFAFIQNIVINLDTPTKSVMHSEDLFKHFESLYFNAMNGTGMDMASFLVSYVADLTRYNVPSRGIISSIYIEDVIYESPYVFLIEVGNPLRLSHEQSNTDLMATDLYYITIIRELKGNAVITYDTVMIFVANTVSQGERHIVAVEPISEGSSWFQLTSRNSIFQIEQMSEITSILAGH